jgi:hypothetical protein
VTSPGKIEQDTGFSFFTALPANIATVFRTEIDGAASAPSFSLLTFTNNQFQFMVNGTTGSNYVVQATADLATTNWISIQTNAAPFLFIQSNANSFSQRFYRATVAP